MSVPATALQKKQDWKNRPCRLNVLKGAASDKCVEGLIGARNLDLIYLTGGLNNIGSVVMGFNDRLEPAFEKTDMPSKDEPQGCNLKKIKDAQRNAGFDPW
jgi:hypothetical protein